MTWLFADGDALISIVAFIATTIAIFLSLTAARREYSRRAHSLSAASDALRAHFYAAQKLVNDPAVSEQLKDFVCAISRTVGQRDAAYRLYKSIVGAPEAVPSDENRKYMDAIMSEIRALRVHRQDLFEAVAIVTQSGMAAMVLRWPETAGAAVHLLAEDARHKSEPETIVRRQATRVIRSMPDDVRPSRFIPLPAYGN